MDPIIKAVEAKRRADAEFTAAMLGRRDAIMGKRPRDSEICGPVRTKELRAMRSKAESRLADAKVKRDAANEQLHKLRNPC